MLKIHKLLGGLTEHLRKQIIKCSKILKRFMSIHVVFVAKQVTPVPLLPGITRNTFNVIMVSCIFDFPLCLL